MIANIPGFREALNLFLNAMLICYITKGAHQCDSFCIAVMRHQYIALFCTCVHGW
jgi:hypothetical protein